MATWLLLDCNNLLHRAWHVGRKKAAGEPRFVVYEFLAGLRRLQSYFQTERVAFAFDGPMSLRQGVCPAYKQARREQQKKSPPAEAEERIHFNRQLVALKNKYLPELGHANIFWAFGYEADDVLASLVQHSLPEGDRAVLVSSDHDLYQLLEAGRVSQWLPHKRTEYTELDFEVDYGIAPDQWPQVLALAGDSDLPGIPGIGLGYALAAVQNTLGRETKAYKKIGLHRQTALDNEPLVKLPYEGTPTFVLKPDTTSARKWRAFCKQLGFEGLAEVR